MNAPVVRLAGQETVVAVDARTLAQRGKGIPRFLFETLRELGSVPGIRPILFSNRPLHPDNALPFETVIDSAWQAVPGTIWMLLRINKLAVRAGATIVWGPAHVLPPKVARLRTILTVHDLVHHVMPQSMSAWNRFIGRRLVDASIRRADRLVADTEATRADVTRFVGIQPELMSVVYLGAQPAPARDAVIGESSRGPNLFALGSIEPRKNIDGLLACLPYLLERRPGLRLRLTGAHSWKSGDTLQKLRDNTACDLLGFLPDAEIAKEMASAAAFIMPSHYEGFGLPIVEAVGLAPIIASDIPVFRELSRFIDGIHFVDFRDPARAARSIDKYLEANPAPASYRVGAERLFRWDTVARRYAELFEEQKAMCS